MNIIDIIKTLAFLLSLVGIYYQTKKNIAGWFFHLSSNALWIIMLLPENQWVLIISAITYSALNIYGIWKWRKKDVSKTESGIYIFINGDKHIICSETSDMNKIDVYNLINSKVNNIMFPYKNKSR